MEYLLRYCLGLITTLQGQMTAANDAIAALQIQMSSSSSTLALLGSGSPEGVVTADPGRFYIDTDTNTLYKKVSGTGNTGWA